MFKLILACCFIMGMFHGLEARLPLDNPQENFDKKMDDTVAKQEQVVQNLKTNATRKDVVPTWNAKLELENAIIQLEVKKTLVGNFRNSESLKSQAVKDALLQVLNKPIITTGDLAELQSLVLQEKAKLRAQKPETQPVETHAR